MAIDARRRAEALRYVQPVGDVLARAGLTGNAMTAAGLTLALVAAGLIVTGRFALGGVALGLGGIADLLDGSVARARGATSVRGGFYDSVSDRLADGAVLSALAWALRDDPLLFAAVLVALVMAEVTSYTRAKAESLSIDCSVGLFERAERTLILVAGLLFHAWLLGVAIVVLAAGATITVGQRVVHVTRSTRPSSDEGPGE